MRSLARRTTLTSTAIVVLVSAALGGWLALGRAPAAGGSVWFQVTKTGTGTYFSEPDQPFFFLAVGNDNREGCDDDSGLGDAIHVVGVNPKSRQATILNVPRDTQAPSGDKINAYYGTQGLPGIVNQLNRMMGVQISFAVTANFCRFMQLVDAIGGIDVNVPAPMHDSDSGSNFNPGVQHLDGEQTLAFTRDRKSFLRGDIERSANQATVMVAALAQVRAKANDPAATIRLAATMASRARLQDISVRELFRIGRLLTAIDPAQVRSVTIPVAGGSATNTTLSLGAGATELFADFAADGVAG